MRYMAHFSFDSKIKRVLFVLSVMGQAGRQASFRDEQENCVPGAFSATDFLSITQFVTNRDFCHFIHNVNNKETLLISPMSCTTNDLGQPYAQPPPQNLGLSQFIIIFSNPFCWITRFFYLQYTLKSFSLTLC